MTALAPARSEANGFSGEMTRKLVDEVELLTMSSPASEHTSTEDQEKVVSQLIAQYQSLDAETQQQLTQLAKVSTSTIGRELRAAICRAGSVALSVSENRLEVSAEILPPVGGGRAVTVSDVMQLLRERNIVCGVQGQAITQCVAQASRGEIGKGPVALGKPAAHGEPGRVEANPGELLPAVGAHSGTQQWMAKQDEVLVRVVAPTDGVAGTDVYGSSLPATPGAAAALAVEGEVTFDESTQCYLARTDGLAVFDGTRIELRRQVVWPGDFTCNDPPIDFSGKVKIRGTIRDGARVTATEDIEIGGGIEGATVISSGGSVIVKQGIAGRNRAFVSAAKLIDVRYIENATVYCAGDIMVRHAVIRSKLSAGKAMRVDLDKGVIFGGDIRAGTSVTARCLGNAAGLPTLISTGHDWAAMEQLVAREVAIAALRQQVEHLAELIQRFQRARPEIEQLTPRERKAYGTLLMRHVVVKHELRAKQEEYERLDGLRTLDGIGEVICREALFPGTVVKIGSATLHVKSNLPACTLRWHTEKQQIQALSAAGRPLKL